MLSIISASDHSYKYFVFLDLFSAAVMISDSSCLAPAHFGFPTLYSEALNPCNDGHSVNESTIKSVNGVINYLTLHVANFSEEGYQDSLGRPRLRVATGGKGWNDTSSASMAFSFSAGEQAVHSDAPSAQCFARNHGDNNDDGEEVETSRRRKNARGLIGRNA